MKGQKKRPAPTSSTAGTCLPVVSIGSAPVPKVGLNNIYSQQKHMCKYSTNGTGSDGERNAYIKSSPECAKSSTTSSPSQLFPAGYTGV